MTFILEKARKGYDKRLSLFNSPPVEVAIQEIYHKHYRPISQITRDSTLEFEVYNNSSDYILMNEITLLLSLQILTDTGKRIKLGNNVALVNFPACTIFRQQDFAIQHQILTSSIGTNFQYKAVLDALLRYGQNDQLSWMSVAGFNKDGAGDKIIDDHNPANSPNDGLNSRYERTKGGQIAQYKTKLFNDVCDQERFLLNGLPINLKLYQAKDKQRLMYADIVSSYFSNKFTGDTDGKATPTTPVPPTSPLPPPKEDAEYYVLDIVDATLVVPYAKIY